MNSNLLGSFGRMFPDCSLAMMAGTSGESSVNWTNGGIMEHGELLMLNTSDWPSAAEGSSVCSLASILEPDVAPKFYLSRKACAGILRRAEKRGKELPTTLAQALARVAEGQGQPEKHEGKTA